jgi:hypothetical protein
MLSELILTLFAIDSHILAGCLKKYAGKTSVTGHDSVVVVDALENIPRRFVSWSIYVYSDTLHLLPW